MILKPDFLKNNSADSLLVFHCLNVNLANKLFRSRLYDTFFSIMNLMDIAMIAVTSFWYSKSSYSLSHTYVEAINHLGTQWFIVILLLLDLLGVPYFFVRFLPGIIGRIVLYIIRKGMHI